MQLKVVEGKVEKQMRALDAQMKSQFQSINSKIDKVLRSAQPRSV